MSIKKKRIELTNWIRTNFLKENTMNILFLEQKMFNINGGYDSQDDRIWAK